MIRRSATSMGIMLAPSPHAGPARDGRCFDGAPGDHDYVVVRDGAPGAGDADDKDNRAARIIRGIFSARAGGEKPRLDAPTGFIDCARLSPWVFAAA